MGRREDETKKYAAGEDWKGDSNEYQISSFIAACRRAEKLREGRIHAARRKTTRQAHPEGGRATKKAQKAAPKKRPKPKNPGEFDFKRLKFWKKIHVNEVSGCWEYVGKLDQSGYGSYHCYIHRYKRYYGKATHRLSYEKFKGTIPEGYHVDHMCRFRACCNPAHLEAVTPEENQRRKTEARRGSE